MRTIKTFWGTCLVAKVSFLQLLCEIRLIFETMLQNIRCFISYIVIIVLGSFRKQGIVFLFYYEVGKISLIHIRGRETPQTGNPSDEFPVLVWIREEKVIWLTDMNSH